MNTTRNAAPDRSIASSAPDFSTLLPTPLVLDEVVLMSYVVLHNRLELRLKSPRLQIDVAELLTHLVKISAGKYVVRCTLESLRLTLCILSVTSTKTATLLRCQTLKDPQMAAALLPMVGRPHLSLIIGEGPRPRGGHSHYQREGIITEKPDPPTCDAASTGCLATHECHSRTEGRLFTNTALIRYGPSY